MNTESHREEIQRPLLICCSVLRNELETLIAQKKIKVDTIYLCKHLHDDIKKLHQALSATLHKHHKRKPIVVYGDRCLDSENRMQALMNEFSAVKVDALNCLDCLLGGHGKVSDIDQDRRFYYLTPGFIEFFKDVEKGKTAGVPRHLYKMLEGAILLDSLDNMEQYRDDIDHFCNQTGLSIIKHIPVGLSGLKAIIDEAIEKTSKSRDQ